MSGIPAHWIAYCRPDGELVGWIDLDTEAPRALPIDRLGRPLPAVDGWDEAEEALTKTGLGVLMPEFLLRDGDRERRVTITQVYDDRVVVVESMADAGSDPTRQITIPFPPGDRLRDA